MGHWSRGQGDWDRIELECDYRLRCMPGCAQVVMAAYNLDENVFVSGKADVTWILEYHYQLLHTYTVSFTFYSQQAQQRQQW